MTRVTVRRIALGTAAVVAMLAVALAIFAATFDVNRYKPEIIDAVQQRTGRTLVFDGDLALSVFPRVAIRLPATSVSEPGRQDVAARLQAGSAKLALWPLLRKRLVVDAVRIEGLQATVVRAKDGRTSFDDMVRPQATPAPSVPQQGAPAAPTASVGRIEFVNADITLRDLGAGRAVRLSAFDVSLGRIAASARTPVRAHGLLAVDTPLVNAKVDAKAALQWDANGGLAGVEDLTANAEGTWQQQPARLNASADRLLFAAQQLEVRALKARLRTEGAAPLDADISAPQLKIAAANASGDRIALALKRSGTEPLDAKAVVEGLRGNAARLEASAMRLNATARSGTRITKVDVTAPLVASLDERTLRIEHATGEALIEDASTAKPLRVPFSASAALDGVHQTIALQFESRADALRGRAKVDIAGFSAPRIVFDVDAEQIDIDRLAAPPPAAVSSTTTAPAKANATATPPAKVGSAPVDQKIEWAALRALNANGKLRVARLRVHGNDFAEVRSGLQAAAGRVEIAPVAFRVYGGSVEGRLALDAQAGRAALNGTFNGVELRRAVGQVGKRAAIEGRAGGTFALNGHGATVTQLKRSLDGKVAVDVRDGALVGIDLADLIGAAKNLGRGRETGALDEGKRTPFSQLSASARIAGGVAVNDDLKARSPQLDVTGGGRIDLVTTELDYTLRAQVLAGPATDKTPLRSLAGVTVPVHITGETEHPRYAVDWTAVAADALLKRAAGRSGSSVNQVIEGLGDLLGRRKK